MKIEKGMTLEQFVDYVDKYISYDNHQALGFEFVKSYNNRLKEPLTKEMFVNPYEKPKKETYFVDGEFKEKYYLEDFETWQEAEKKVIFKNVNLFAQSIHCYVFTVGNHGISFFSDGRIMFGNLESGKDSFPTTLDDLFRATNGELELKNFEV